MKVFNLLSFVFLLYASVSCNKDKANSKNSGTSEIVLKESAAEFSDALSSTASLKSDPFNLDSIHVQGNTVAVDVSYQGGCSQHSFEIIWNESVTNSNPPEIKLAVIHIANGDRCKAYITETLTFNLADLIDSSMTEAVSVAAFSGYNPADSTIHEGDKFDFTVEESDVCNMTVTASEVICGWGLWDNIWFATGDSISAGMEGFYFKKYLQPVAIDASLNELRPVPGRKYRIGVRLDHSAENPGVPVCMAYPGPSIPVKIMCLNEVK